jgi:hypothetical protein
MKKNGRKMESEKWGQKNKLAFHFSDPIFLPSFSCPIPAFGFPGGCAVKRTIADPAHRVTRKVKFARIRL